MVWGVIHHGERSELVVLHGILNRQRSIRLIRDSMLACVTDIFGWNSVCPGQCHAPHKMWHDWFSGTTGCGGHGLVSPESKHEPHWECLGSNGGLDQRQGWAPLYAARTVPCCPSCVGLRLQFAQIGWGPWWRAYLIVCVLLLPPEEVTQGINCVVTYM